MSHFYYFPRRARGYYNIQVPESVMRRTRIADGHSNLPDHIDATKEGSGRKLFFTCMALAMLAVAAAGFLPSLLHRAGRRAPLSPLVAVHGILFIAWLIIFLAQSRLIATGHVSPHRRVGVAATFVLGLMVPVGYATTVAMVRRGFDLSGDLRIDHDPLYESIFPFGDLLTFTVLAIAAIAYRQQPEIQKRLMLFANIALMGAPLAHLIGHTPRLAAMPGAIIMVPSRCSWSPLLPETIG